MKPSGTRDELLTALAELTEQHPEWRLGQMIANLAMAAGRTEASGVWDVEDSEALEAAQHLLERHRQQIA
jgi:hypothetical protein